MARSLTTIMTQIERLQREAAAIQGEAVNRIRKEIAKLGLTAEQLFGSSALVSTSKRMKNSPASREAKYADGHGNTWGGMGKRPMWLRSALEEGKSLDNFLVAKASNVKAPRAAKGPSEGRMGASKRRVNVAKTAASKNAGRRRVKADNAD